MPDQSRYDLYHERAERLRKIAAEIRDEKSRELLLTIAAESEQLATALDSFSHKR